MATRRQSITVTASNNMLSRLALRRQKKWMHELGDQTMFQSMSFERPQTLEQRRLQYGCARLTMHSGSERASSRP